MTTNDIDMSIESFKMLDCQLRSNTLIQEAEKIVKDYKPCIKAIGHIREILKEPYTPSNVKVSMIETIIEGIK